MFKMIAKCARTCGSQGYLGLRCHLTCMPNALKTVGVAVNFSNVPQKPTKHPSQWAMVVFLGRRHHAAASSTSAWSYQAQGVQAWCELVYLSSVGTSGQHSFDLYPKGGATRPRSGILCSFTGSTCWRTVCCTVDLIFIEGMCRFPLHTLSCDFVTAQDKLNVSYLGTDIYHLCL